MSEGLKILFEDNHVIAVHKPAGLLVQPASPKTASRGGPDKAGGHCLMDEVKKYLKEKYGKKGNVFLGLVHRLDRNVSGIVLFGKTSKGASRLSEQFRNNEIKKIYTAIVGGRMEQNKGKLIHFLKKDEAKRIAGVSDSPEGGFERSELEYEVIKENNNYSLLKIYLITGRFHQIRAQLSAVGHPVLGDKKYGSKEELKDGSLALCATETEFKTATTGETVKIKIDIPPDWPSVI